MANPHSKTLFSSKNNQLLALHIRDKYEGKRQKQKQTKKTPKQKPLNCEISTETIHIIILHLPKILQKAKQPTEIIH